MEPITRREMFLNALSDSEQDLPEPITREEIFLKKAAEGGGGGSDLPTVTSGDNGKVLTVVGGKWDKADSGVEAVMDSIAPHHDSTKSYYYGNIVWYNYKIYKCIEDTTGPFDASKWMEISLSYLLESMDENVDFSIDTIAQAIKDGKILALLNFGDQLTVDWADGDTNYDMPLNFCHFEVAKDANDNDVNVSDFESHYVLPFDLVYDDPEAIVALDENQTLTAGDYYLKIINDSWGNNNNKYICFTLESDLEPPYQIRKKSGTYNAAIEDCTLGIYTSGADRTGTALAFTVETTQPSSGTDLGQTDGTGYCNHWHCVALGYNRWKYSAIRQFLNSDATAGNWWTQQHKWDVMPAYATTKNGFLYGLSASVKQYLVETKVYTSRNTVFNSGDIPLGGMDETLDKVFLISLEQSYIEPQITGEGEYWEYYKNLLGTNAPVSRNSTYPLLIKYDIGGKTTACYRWLRSAFRGYTFYAWYVLTSGYVHSTYCVTNGLRCAPCLRIGISN